MCEVERNRTLSTSGVETVLLISGCTAYHNAFTVCMREFKNE
jgi:hypothetical protein